MLKDNHLPLLFKNDKFFKDMFYNENFNFFSNQSIYLDSNNFNQKIALDNKKITDKIVFLKDLFPNYKFLVVSSDTQNNNSIHQNELSDCINVSFDKIDFKNSKNTFLKYISYDKFISCQNYNINNKFNNKVYILFIDAVPHYKKISIINNLDPFNIIIDYNSNQTQGLIDFEIPAPSSFKLINNLNDSILDIQLEIQSTANIDSLFIGNGKINKFINLYEGSNFSLKQTSSTTRKNNNYIFCNHIEENTKSNIVLNNFNFGGINNSSITTKIHQKAHNSIAIQYGKNLLFNKNSESNFRPNLIIENSNTQCHHGQSTSSISLDEKNYLSHRGLSVSNIESLFVDSSFYDFFSNINLSNKEMMHKYLNSREFV